MADWRQYLRLGREQTARVPALAWMIAGVVAVAFAVVLALELSGPPYVALYEGLSPEQGGAVVAQLQKLGIPYQLQAAGNIILVPAPQLAEARLQLGQAQVVDVVGTGQAAAFGQSPSRLAQHPVAGVWNHVHDGPGQ